MICRPRALMLSVYPRLHWRAEKHAQGGRQSDHRAGRSREGHGRVPGRGGQLIANAEIGGTVPMWQRIGNDPAITFSY
jgi:hypothetical protein